jgi:LysR family nitrogen assimilation transcriptional regulator
VLPFSGFAGEVEAGTLAAALLPWMRAERVLALPRGRPVSRATREVMDALREVCGDLAREGKLQTISARGKAQ